MKDLNGRKQNSIDKDEQATNNKDQCDKHTQAIIKMLGMVLYCVIGGLLSEDGGKMHEK